MSAKKIFKGVLFYFGIHSFLFGIAGSLKAEMAYAEQNQPIFIPMVETEETIPDPIPAPETIYDEPSEHSLKQDEVETIAKLLWSSPLRDRKQKKALAWVVMNRVGIYPYGSSVTEVVNKTEFPFYDRKAHISEENTEIATEVLNEFYSMQDGKNIKRTIPKDGVAICFVGEGNRKIKVLDYGYNTVWDGGKL